jgi:hypothetical protein
MKVLPRLVEMGALPESALSGDEWKVDAKVSEQLIAAAQLAECCTMPCLPTLESSWFSNISQVQWPGRWLLECVFSNPFRPVSLDPTWRTPTVLSLATAAYEERILPSGHLEADRLAILGDALEDAGCTNAEVLAHLRGPGPHVRGCWVLDLLLDRK